MKRRLPHLIAALALAALTACGSGSAEPFGAKLPDGFKPSQASEPAGSPGASHAEEPDGHGGEDHPDKADHEKAPDGTDPHDEFKYTAEKPPPETFRDPDVDGGRTGSGKLRLQMKITPACIEPGGVIEVTMKTKPDVQVAFFTQFKEAPSGKMRVYEGRTNALGLFTQKVPSDPDQMPHQYVVQGAAADDKGSDGGHSGQWFHVVAEEGGCA